MELTKLKQLAESRQSDFKYTEKHVKGALSKVILELEGSSSGAMSRLMTRYQRLDRSAKLLAEKRNEVNAQVKDVADRLFDAEDAVATRIIETISYTVMLTKSEKAADKEDKKKIDYESAFGELSRLVPDLEAAVKKIIEKHTEIIPAKDTPTALRVTSKIAESVAGTILTKIKSFVTSIKEWATGYDSKLSALKKKFPVGKVVAEATSKAFVKKTDTGVPSTAKQQRIARDYFDKKFPDYELPLTVKNGPDGSKYFATTASTDDWVTSKSGCCRVAADGTITGVTLNAFMNLPTATEGKLTEAVGSKNVKEILRGVKWHQTDNDWHSAKSVAREIFKQLDDSDIDVMLALRNAAEVQRKKNSFLGAALAELAKDQAEKLGTTNRD